MTSARVHIGLQEAADFLGVSTATIRRYIARGSLPAYRIAGSRLMRIKHEDVEGMLRRIPTVEAWEAADHRTVVALYCPATVRRSFIGARQQPMSPTAFAQVNGISVNTHRHPCTRGEFELYYDI